MTNQQFQTRLQIGALVAVSIPYSIVLVGTGFEGDSPGALGDYGPFLGPLLTLAFRVGPLVPVACILPWCFRFAGSAQVLFTAALIESCFAMARVGSILGVLSAWRFFGWSPLFEGSVVAYHCAAAAFMWLILLVGRRRVKPAAEIERPHRRLAFAVAALVAWVLLDGGWLDTLTGYGSSRELLRDYHLGMPVPIALSAYQLLRPVFILFAGIAVARWKRRATGVLVLVACIDALWSATAVFMDRDDWRTLVRGAPAFPVLDLLTDLRAGSLVLPYLFVLAWIAWSLRHAVFFAGGSPCCPACGHNVTGLPSNRCPECGNVFAWHAARTPGGDEGA